MLGLGEAQRKGAGMKASATTADPRPTRKTLRSSGQAGVWGTRPENHADVALEGGSYLLVGWLR